MYIAIVSFWKPITAQKVNYISCKVKQTLIDLNPSELLYYPFVVSLYRCNGSCTIFDHLSGKICVPNITEDMDIKVFNMITGTHESKSLVKQFMWFWM